MKTGFIFLLLLISVRIYGQSELPKRSIEISGGYSRTGSGDMPGVMFGASYSQYIKPKLSWSVGFNGMIYDGYDYIVERSLTNGHLRYATAGVQIAGHIATSLVRTESHEFKLGAGGLVKYQTETKDGSGIIYPPIINYPEPVISLYNQNPQRTVAAGVSVQLGYNYTIQNKISIGLLASGQTDTNGDLIVQAGLTLGRRF